MLGALGRILTRTDGEFNEEADGRQGGRQAAGVKKPPA